MFTPVACKRNRKNFNRSRRAVTIDRATMLERLESFAVFCCESAFAFICPFVPTNDTEDVVQSAFCIFQARLLRGEPRSVRYCCDKAIFRYKRQLRQSKARLERYACNESGIAYKTNKQGKPVDAAGKPISKYFSRVGYDVAQLSFSNKNGSKRSAVATRLGYVDTGSLKLALLDCPQEHRTLVRWLLAGYSQADIASRLGVSRKTISLRFAKFAAWYKESKASKAPSNVASATDKLDAPIVPYVAEGFTKALPMALPAILFEHLTYGPDAVRLEPAAAIAYRPLQSVKVESAPKLDPVADSGNGGWSVWARPVDNSRFFTKGK